MAAVYDKSFYLKHQASARSSAEATVSLLAELAPLRSVLDLGCGLGTWLAALRSRGILDVRGVDGDYVRRDLLEIPSESFTVGDLTQPLALGRTFDLAMSLEVAEHLPGAAGPVLVESLTRHAPLVLFSAAVPGQGGENHINCRWPEYWATLFSERGYDVIDCLRPRLWGRLDVDWWYQQNMLLFAERAHLAATPGLAAAAARHPNRPALAMVHPGLYQAVLDWGVEQERALWQLRAADRSDPPA